MPNSKDEKQIQALAQRILVGCANKLGGMVALAKCLDVSENQVREWVMGATVPPVAIVLKAVDLLTDSHLYRQFDTGPMQGDRILQ